MAAFNMDAFSSFGSFGMPQAVKPKPKAELLTATSPVNYALCWEVVTNEAHAEVIRCSAFSYASSGMLAYSFLLSLVINDVFSES